jgi:4-hydroxybenzoate polyprenyltransferase
MPVDAAEKPHARPPSPSVLAHVAIMRADHWVKNVFVLPGIAVALGSDHTDLGVGLFWNVLVGMISVCLIASSNYVLNELLDAPFDRLHPTKSQRPVPSGRVSVRWAYVQWLVLMLAGLALAWWVSLGLAATMSALWLMGCVYNVPPVRSKDLPYVDVMSEAVNNPLRMLAGWFMVGPAGVPPLSLLLSYWMVGCFFMAAKRFAEFREIGHPAQAASYRRSFAFYTGESLLVSIVFYASAAMLFFGAFLMRYRLELVLSFPLIAWVMAVYLHIAFQPDSAAQAPEKLYREPWLMASVVACAAVMLLCLFVDIPLLRGLFHPSEFGVR